MKTAEQTAKPPAHDVAKPSARGPTSDVQFSTLGTLPYSDQVEAIRPPMPLQFNLASAGAVQMAGGSGTPTPMTRDEAKTAITTKAASYADLADALAGTLTSTAKADFDTRYASVTNLQKDVIKEYVKGGDSKAKTQQVGKDDPIAIQKFQDVDQEAHLEDASVKTQFYDGLRSGMQNGDLTDRTRTFPLMQSTAGNTYKFKGTLIPADRLTAVSTRNQGLNGMLGVANTAAKAQIAAAIEAEMVALSATPAQIATAQGDWNTQVKAFASILKSGVDPMSLIDKRHNITQGYGTWYHPGAIVPSLDPDPDVAFTDMMTLGALQPEWYAEGTVVLEIDMSAKANRVCRKPTAFDGLMSSVWVARNLSDSDYGLTGGGAAEFLEANVPYRFVTSARAVIPSDTLKVELQRLIDAAPANSTPTEEALRGSTAAAGGSAEGLYDSVIDSTVNEQNTPGANPTVAGAASPNTSASPSGPAVAPGGAYDRP